MQRIIHIASNPGDIVLDCFAGSATTAAVAQKMGRRWVTIERSRSTVDTFAAPRLKKVVQGDDPGGITSMTTRERVGPLPRSVEPEDAQAFTSLLNKFEELLLDGPEEEPGNGEELEGDALTDQPDAEEPDAEVESASEDDNAADDEDDEAARQEIARRKAIKAVVKQLRVAARTKTVTRTNWEGGGGFRVLDVAPSMFEDDAGTVVVAEWASNGKLAEATAAQLGFNYEPGAPFVGRKGKARLAVVDGLVNPDVARLLVDALADDELLTLCGTAVDPATAEALRKMRRGSVVRKIPASILAEYRRPRWQASAPQVSNESES